MAERGQLPKAYLRIDPNLDSTHPAPGDMVALLCAANRQPTRGYFKSVEVARSPVPADDPRAQWDGHTTAEKYEAIRAIPFGELRGPAVEAAP